MWLFRKVIHMKKLLLLFIAFILTSCIPLRIAPNIKTDKVVIAKRFMRKLPKNYAFIFEDPKDANEFYNYINTKYQLNHVEVGWDVPFNIDGNEFYFSFYEVEKTTKTINLLPLALDATLEAKDIGPLFEDSYTSRTGKWYLAITVADQDSNDCLKPDYMHRDVILKYFRNLKYEYLNTHNYVEVLLKN